MAFFIRKLMEAMLLPLGVCILLLLVGLLLGRRWLIVLAVATLYIFSTPFAGRLLLGPLERVYGAETVAECPKADAVVVLSGSDVRGVTAAGIQYGESASRYFSGVDLVRAGKANLIVFTAARIQGEGEATEGEILRQAAVQQGLPAQEIRVTPQVWTTRDEAREVSSIPGVHSVILVTSAFHMPRAALLFRAQGLQVFPFPSDQRVFGGLDLSPRSFIPLAEGLRNSDSALREYYGLAIYHVILLFRRHRNPPAEILPFSIEKQY